MAYRLKLPLASAIHSGFHVSQLKKMIGDQRVQSNFPDAYINKPVIEPDRVLGTRKVEGKQEVLIWWKGLPKTEAT
ncbi:putative mitochondrial protein [Tanacetum coccineum]